MALGDIITGAGQAIQDLFGSEGATAEANSYYSAAALAQQNAALTSASTKIQETQTQRQIAMTEGTQQADVASAGFTESGSALDLLRSSAQQGALAKSLVNIQGAINENSYAAQAGAYTGAAQAAGENASANQIAAIASIGGSLVSNAGDLLSAGKTVVSGVNYVSNAIENLGTTDYTSAIGPTLTGDPLAASTVDQAVSDGADLSAQAASSGIGIDTSELSIGTDVDAADTGVADAFSSISDSVSGAVSDVADSLGLDGLSDLGLDAALGPIGLVASVASFIPGVGSVVNDVTSAVTSAVGDVFSGIGSIFGSVICTAFYKLGYIRHRIWMGDQKYGSLCNPTVFKGYYYWGKPIADFLLRHPRVASFAFRIFRPTIYEMSARVGIGKRTYLGSVSLGFFIVISFVVGSILNLKEKVYAGKSRTSASR